MEDPTDLERLQRLHKLKNMLHEIEGKLVPLVETFDWDCSKLLGGDDCNMATCSINSQHVVPKNKINDHEEYCFLRSQGYNESDKIFSEYSGSGSCISLTSEHINSITKNVSSAVETETLRPIPQTSANFDQNFNREEKLAIYDYIIENTKKQKAFSDLWKQISEKKEEKREMTVWEIAAAERDAKRRRATYRNKDQSNCKTHTQILRELIEAQMEMLKEESSNEKSSGGRKKPSTDSRCPEDGRKCHKSSSARNDDDDRKRKHYSDHYWRKSHSNKISRRDSRDNSGSRSRSCDKYRKWKTSEGRSHFYKSSR